MLHENNVKYLCNNNSYLNVAEIYRIVSQRQIRDPPEGDTIRPQNVEPIDVKPTMNSDGMRKQCCQ